MLRKLVHLFRRATGIPGAIDVLIEHTNNQTADLTAHMSNQAEALQSHLAEQVVASALQIAQTAPAKPDHSRAAEPPDVQMLGLLARGLQSDGHLGLQSLCELEALSRKGVFVVGNARSGTTILQKCLNLSKDVYLLDESNVYVNHSKPEFHSWFNRQHQEFKNARAKGTFIPEPPVPLDGGLAYLAWLARHYRYVGEKTAFGPHGTWDGAPFQDACLRFQGRFFFLGTYFLIVRTPVECVWSMHKMFPDATVESLIESWLRSVSVCMDFYAAFPNCYLLFFQDLTDETITVLSQILQTEIPLPSGMLCERRKASRLPAGQIPEDLSAFRKPLEDCLEIFDHLRRVFSPHTLRYDSTDAIARFSGLLERKVTAALDSIVPPATCPKYEIARRSA